MNEWKSFFFSELKFQFRSIQTKFQYKIEKLFTVASLIHLILNQNGNTKGFKLDFSRKISTFSFTFKNLVLQYNVTLQQQQNQLKSSFIVNSLSANNYFTPKTANFHPLDEFSHKFELLSNGASGACGKANLQLSFPEKKSKTVTLLSSWCVTTTGRLF